MTTENKMNLISLQIDSAKAQQAAVVTAEDFYRADHLAKEIEKHTQEKEKCENDTRKIRELCAKLDGQREVIVREMTCCFERVREQLDLFKMEQERLMGDELMKSERNFKAMSTHISQRWENIAIELGKLQCFENAVAKERRELEKTTQEKMAIHDALRSESSSKLDVVKGEIVGLRKRLKEKQTEKNGLSSTVTVLDVAIAEIRSMFSSELNSLTERETSIKEDRQTWESNKTALEKKQEFHEKEAQDNSQTARDYVSVQGEIDSEIAAATRMEQITSQEVKATHYFHMHAKFISLQAEIEVFQTAVVKSRKKVIAAETNIVALQEKVKHVEQRLQFLDTEKKAAVSTRNFRAAATVLKDIECSLARKKHIEGAITGVESERNHDAKKKLASAVFELETKKRHARLIEKGDAIKCLTRLLKQINELEHVKKEICVSGKESNNVALMGTSILDENMYALKREGEIFSAKFGGWAVVRNSANVLDANVAIEKGHINGNTQHKDLRLTHQGHGYCGKDGRLEDNYITIEQDMSIISPITFQGETA